MAPVKRPIQQRGGHDLVTGEHFGPVLDGLVGGDQGGALLVAGGVSLPRLPLDGEATDHAQP